MLSNYLKIAFRNIRKQKGYSAINIFGFTIGITSCLLILMYVAHELSYDRFHVKANRIYRVAFDGQRGKDRFTSVHSSAPAAAGFKNEFPEVEAATRFHRLFCEQVVRVEEKYFNEKNICRVDAH